MLPITCPEFSVKEKKKQIILSKKTKTPPKYYNSIKNKKTKIKWSKLLKETLNSVKI